MYNTFHRLYNHFHEIVKSEAIQQMLLDKTDHVSQVISLLMVRVDQLKSAIVMMLESHAFEESSILARTLLETTVRIADIMIDKPSSPRKAASYLTKGDGFQSGVLEDIKQRKIVLSRSTLTTTDLNKIDKRIKTDKQRTAQLLGYNLSDLEYDRKVETSFQKLNLNYAYTHFYRHFSQYVHSFPQILEILDQEKREYLGDQVVLSCTLCWVVLIDLFNEYYGLEIDEKLGLWQQEYAQAIQHRNKKWNL